jgi:hypothetical protein
MVFNATFNNISVISWWSVFLEETGIPGESLNNNICIIQPYHHIYKIFIQGAVVAVIVWYLDLQLPMQSVPITTDVVSSNLDQGEVYNNKIELFIIYAFIICLHLFVYDVFVC